jgi:hypothetical protein
MGRIRRRKTAWSSYLGIQAFWALCVVLVPLAFGAYPSKYWALLFCLVTVAGGLHLIYFHREYDHILRKAAGFLPFSRRPGWAGTDPRYLLPIGIAYSLFGVVSALLVILT